MSMQWAIKLDNGITWAVGSMNLISNKSEAQIIIPIEHLDEFTDQEIVDNVRKSVWWARACYITEYAESLTYAQIGNMSWYERQELAEEWEHYAIADERIQQAIAYLRGEAIPPTPQETRYAAPRRTTEGYVYLLRSEHGHKIGRTRQIEQRMSAFGLQLPFPVELIHTIACEDMYQAERELHNRFAHLRINGEWFNLSLEHVQWLLSKQAL
jgi:hypothetical protein